MIKTIVKRWLGCHALARSFARNVNRSKLAGKLGKSQDEPNSELDQVEAEKLIERPKMKLTAEEDEDAYILPPNIAKGRIKNKDLTKEVTQSSNSRISSRTLMLAQRSPTRRS